MVQYHGLVCARAVVFCNKITPSKRLCSKGGKEVGGDHSTVQTFRFSCLRKVETFAPESPELLEGFALSLPIDKVGVSDRSRHLRPLLPQDHETIGICIG